MALILLNKFSLYNKMTCAKAILLIVAICFGSHDLSAQIKGNFKLKLATGVLWTSDSANPGFPWFNGFFLQLEPKLKVSRNAYIGLRFGASINEQVNENFEFLHLYRLENPNTGLIQFINPDNGTFSMVPTFEYHFDRKKLQPYLAGGIGYYFLTNYTEVLKIDLINPSDKPMNLNVNNQIGFLLRGGLELRKFTIGLEFNLIPKAAVSVRNTQKIGIVSNSFAGLSIGYTITPGNISK